MLLDHIQLAIPEGGEERARSYFVDLLGMNGEPKPDSLASRGGCWFRLGSCVVHVGVDPEFVPQLKAHPAFVVTDVQDVAKRLIRAGHEVRWDPSVPGTNRFFTDDPFGNRIEFIAEGHGFSQHAGGAF